MKEYHAFCLWREHRQLVKEIYNNFEVVLDKKFSFPAEERAKKVRSIYEVFIVNKDERIWSNHPIQIIVVKVDSKYTIRTTAGSKNTRFVNKHIFDFKTKVRQKFNINHRFIHATDHIGEASLIFKSFDIQDFNSGFTMVNLKSCKAVLWNITPFGKGLDVYNKHINYNYTDIINTPHYNFLFGKEHEYKLYISEIDTHHADISRFKSLIRNFDSQNYGSDDRVIKICFTNHHPVIFDGLHRASILLQKYKHLEQINIKAAIEKNSNYK